ncbi:uncharacterized protein LOC133861169 [Alnus glutinosa]|uniref:uncharacterized protein LOC133861169 n=1 Tax=Alnus glutinosa TaxID=3517 RepID=UPI002D764DA2|nr:uncharacterized protein LOC133861169 [Alnus glutinosa]
MPDSARREESWALLQHLRIFQPIPWLCAGDFNEILEQNEKCGAAIRRESQMDGFRQALVTCGLGDLGYVGPCFTWSNGRVDSLFTKERLDRALANREWCSIFPYVTVHVLAASSSDHNPILVHFNEFQEERQTYRRSFKFESAWTRDEDYLRVLQSGWEEEIGNEAPVRGVQQRLSSCQTQFSRWSKKKFGRVGEILKKKKQQLLHLQSRALPFLDPVNKTLQAKIDELLANEDLYWKQRAKQNWYQHGDRNTQFFHSWANSWRKTNTICRIFYGNGRVWRKKEEISMLFLDYYKMLSSSSNPVGIEGCLNSIECRVSNSMNQRLLRPFTEDEVRFALFQMHPLKSPGPDDFSADFYQKSWEVVRKEVSRAVLNVLNGGSFDAGLNSTNICLVPKVAAPSYVTEFRPISLCNVIYKIISKAIANRLKIVLPTIISQEQSAFLPGRLITDNILVAFEALHTMDTRLKGREGFMAMKLDMSKAYDRLEWDFLEAMMRKLVPTRGIRQGDPPSPYFFIICAEAMSSMLQNLARVGAITGVPIVRGRSRVSTFNGIKGRIWNRINGWKEKFLSHVGKEILLKSVIQAIPTYTMSVFWLPKTLCREINMMMGKFWWGFKDNHLKIPWMSWSGLRRKKSVGGLGYRDLESFNSALLAKQGWRFTKFPTTLVARVFKEKYFRDGDFLSSNLGNRPSYAWRSTWGSKPLLNEGLLWRIGDGSNIKILGDKWIPTTYSHEIQVHSQEIQTTSTVSELINMETNWWNIFLIEYLFQPDIAEHIYNIAISPRTMHDRLIWGGTANGEFAVRSAYHMELDRRDSLTGSSSDVGTNLPLWNSLWQLQIPRTAILFLWRACNEILPTKVNLCRHRVVEDRFCPMCGLEAETTVYAIWNCSAAQAVWTECPARVQKCSVREGGFLACFGFLSSRLLKEELEMLVMVAQRVWFRRNRKVFEDELWVRPPLGFIKLNWDSALARGKQLMGVGVIARDSEGQVVASMCTVQHYISDSVIAEASTIATLEFGKFLNLQSIFLEGDPLEITTALGRLDDDSSKYGNLIMDARRMFRGFRSWNISHVRRDGNMVAHSLAKFVISLKQTRVWF